MVIRNIEGRLEELEINGKHGPNENYVYLHSQAADMDTTISVDTTLQWEKELMTEPKVSVSQHEVSASRLTSCVESPCTFCPLHYRSSPSAHATCNDNRRYAELQCQDQT